MKVIDYKGISVFFPDKVDLAQLKFFFKFGDGRLQSVNGPDCTCFGLFTVFFCHCEF